MASIQEPPSVKTTIPYVGHLFGIMQSKFNYFAELSHKNPYEIFTVNMPGQKMYIVASPKLIQAIEKHPKTLAYLPIEAKFVGRVCGISTAAQNIIEKNSNGEEDLGMLHDVHAAIRAPLAPGAELDSMNRIMIQNIATSLNGLIPSGESRIHIKLVEWLRHCVTIATTNSVYGPPNPFKDREIADAFWEFERNIFSLVMGVLPSITARSGIAARAKVSKAFEQYFKDGSHTQGSILVSDKYKAALSNGVSIEDWAPYEVGSALAILVNTTPTVFWMIFLVFSDPELLADLRTEIESVMTTSTENGIVRNLDITQLKQNCPLLSSTLQEVLRYRSVAASIRQVMEDTVLNDTWLLKKDSILQMPSRIIHTTKAIWGDDVEEFNARRFLKEYVPKNVKKPSATAFRAFGGGTTLCPGRHFATTEVLAIATMFIMRYNIAPLTGKWSLPTVDSTNMTSAIMTPDNDVEVEVSLRKGYEEGEWAFGLKDSEKVFAMDAEDEGN
ncbi:cytochrome P450 [Viridothelium virens]|uniref:Cytochrome P450 n=1 Tax=Viridothelium virens TaxID=1048519 RepID=A0A6A6H253_VIRVR|nr:cytochrome P450 [Viridothelium virens]